MLSFTRYKSREFISILSLCSESIKLKRYLSELQTKVIKNDDYVEYSIHERIHREEKELNRVLPAIIYRNGDQYWYKNGKCHRDDLDENGRVLPAFIGNGDKHWYKNGRIHRDDLDENGSVLPASIWNNGMQFWFKNGLTYINRE